MENFSKKEQLWLEKLLKKIADEATHLANDASEKFINQISIGSKNENKKDKKSKELKVANPSEKTNFQTDANKMQKSTLQKLLALLKILIYQRLRLLIFGDFKK